jgi:stearoyl-CoA desaturase (delta-9 desaturase)
MPLMKRFYTDRYLHIRSFSGSLLAAIFLCLAAYAMHSPAFYRFDFSAWMLLLVPLGIYMGGISAVFIHNATHGSFKQRWMNEASGQLAGLHQLWGYTGWKLIHHHYSDNEAMDTHPPKGMSFWQFTRRMFVYSAACISKRYREHWGETRQTQRLQKATLGIFLAMAAANLLFWYLLLGPAAFVFFYVPSYIANHLLFAHINYFAHPADETSGDTTAANLDNNGYYKLANALWCGIYYHGNHHRRPALFNPKHMPVSRQQPPVVEKMKLAA